MAKTFQESEQEVIQWMQDNPREVIQARKEFMQQLIKRRCSLGEGHILPVTLAPMFLKQESLQWVADTAVALDKILDKAIHLYFKDPYVRSYFPYPDLPLEWIQWDPGYNKPTRLSRHDALFDGKTLKFIEFNTDNPGGRGWVDTYEALARESPIYKSLIKKHCVPHKQSMLHGLKDTLLSAHQEWSGKKKKPRVALVSFKEMVPGSDNEIVRDFLIEQGIEANLVDPRDLEYRKGKLYSGNVAFDVVNLSLRFTFFKRFPREMQDFLKAIEEGAVCAVNHFRATLGSQKEMLSFLSNTENHHYFSEAEAETLNTYLPWTRKMDETITLSPEGETVALQEYVKKHREKLVLKPSWAAGGYEVYVGQFTEAAKWQAAVESAEGCPWWIVQEAVEIPEYDFPVIHESHVKLMPKNLNLNPYVFNGEYAGCLGRVSDSKVINMHAGGGLIPVFGLKA